MPRDSQTATSEYRPARLLPRGDIADEVVTLPTKLPLRSERSEALLSSGTRASSRKTASSFHWPSVYRIAIPSGLFTQNQAVIPSVKVF